MFIIARVKVVFLLLILLPLQGSLSGCASLSNPDPLEPLNRRIFGFNQMVDKAILKPLAVTYEELTPEPVNQGITNFFSNLSELSVIANDLLQFKFKQAASDSGRLVINTTLGLFGFLDLATHFGYPKNYEDFGQTLGYWGVGSGPYLVLPFLGPSSIRDAAGRGVDGFFDPRSHVSTNDDVVLRWHLITNGIYAVDQRASLLEVEKVMEAAALDPYTYLRDAYLQRREYLVKDGNIPTQEDEFDELFSDLE